MWHEARKQERKIRGLLVDYRKRAERRQNFYEKIKADPTQFLQVHGRKCKIHIDLSIAMAAENPKIMMPWLGQKDNLIDRFDARAHLDQILVPPKPSATQESEESEEASSEERMINYERYRVLAQNDFLGINEEKYLYQLYLEELYGVNAQVEQMEKQSKKKSSMGGAAIAYTYEENDTGQQPFVDRIAAIETAAATSSKFDDCIKDESDSDLDMDMSIDINKIGTQQGHEMNTCGRHYGMKSNDFYSFLTRDADEMESLRMAREEEQEKIMFSGRKSRRERRAQRERRYYAVKGTTSPPSYAAKDEFETNDKVVEKSVSRSPSPENSGKVVFITSFGGEEELQPHSKISINFTKGGGTSSSGKSVAGSLGALLENRSFSYADTVKQNLTKLKDLNEKDVAANKKPLQYQGSRNYSRSRSRDRHNWRHGPSRRRYSRSRSRSRSRRRYSRSRSTSHRRRHSRSRSRRRRNSRSRSNNRNSRRSSSSSSSSSVDNRQRKQISRDRSKYSPIANTNSRRSTIKHSPPPLPKLPPPPPPTLVQTKAKSKSVERKVLKQEPRIVVQQPMLVMEPQPPIKRYYGRKRDGDSSSSPSDDEHEPREVRHKDDNDEAMDTSEQINTSSQDNQTNSSSRFGKSTGSSDNKITQSLSSSALQKFNPRDRLKRKMQLLLNKQYKADKKAESEKNERQIQQQQEREEEMRELALRLRKRQRELRHKYGSPSNSRSRSEGSDESEKNGSQQSSSVSQKSTPSPKRPNRESSRSRSRSRGDRRKPSRSRSRSRDRGRSYRSHNRRSRSRTKHSPVTLTNRHHDGHRERGRRSRSYNSSRDRRDSSNREPVREIREVVRNNRENNRNRVTIRRSPVLQRPPVPQRKLVDY